MKQSCKGQLGTKSTLFCTTKPKKSATATSNPMARRHHKRWMGCRKNLARPSRDPRACHDTSCVLCECCRNQKRARADSRRFRGCDRKKPLLVDDIMDTGKSLKLARDHLQNQSATEVRVSTLYYKPSSLFKPDFCKKKTRRWVVFTWDKKEKIRKIEETQRKQCQRGSCETGKGWLTKKLVRVPERKS